MWTIDYPSMMLIILGGIHLGLLGMFGVNIAERFLDGYANLAYDLTGLAAIWQLTRQRYPI